MTSHQAVLGNQSTSSVAEETAADEAAEERRKERNRYGWAMRRLNNVEFPTRQVGKCGLPLQDVAVGRRKADGRVALANVSTCGSVHGCLRCAAVIRAARATEIGHLCRSHLAEGYAIEFVTLTLPHWGTDRLDALLDALRDVWRKMTQRKPYAHMKDRFEVSGMIRSTEFTWSLANGWHPHLHILFFLDRKGLDEDEEHELRARIYQAWQAVVNEVLPGRTVHQAFGIDVRPVRDDSGIGDYVSKIEFEMTRSDLKTDRERASVKGSRTPWQIAIDFTEDGDKADLKLWREYVIATHGARVLGMSQKLRDRYGSPPEADMTDEEIAAQSTEIDVEVEVAAEVFMAARNRNKAHLVTAAMDGFGVGGIRGLLAVLSVLGRVTVEDRSAVGEVPLIRFATAKANVVADDPGRMARLVRKTRQVLNGRLRPVETHVGVTGWTLDIKPEFVR